MTEDTITPYDTVPIDSADIENVGEKIRQILEGRVRDIHNEMAELIDLEDMDEVTGFVPSEDHLLVWLQISTAEKKLKEVSSTGLHIPESAFEQIDAALATKGIVLAATVEENALQPGQQVRLRRYGRTVLIDDKVRPAGWSEAKKNMYDRIVICHKKEVLGTFTHKHNPTG